MYLFYLSYICIETIFKFLGRWSEAHNQTELFEKLQYELMLLGIISFIIFLVQQALIEEPAFLHSEYFASFEIIHIVILFIALSFLCQAVLLVIFAKSDGRRLLQSIRKPETSLLKEYDIYNATNSKCDFSTGKYMLMLLFIYMCMHNIIYYTVCVILNKYNCSCIMNTIIISYACIYT